MKNFKLIQIIAFIAMIAVFSSCKEEEPEPATIESQLIGVWTGDSYYEDGQISDLSDFIKLISNEFKEGGTGTSAITSVGSQPLTWSYDATTKKLRIAKEAVDLGDGFTLEASIVEGATITKIDASNLWYSYQIAGVTIEEHYVK